MPRRRRALDQRADVFVTVDIPLLPVRDMVLFPHVVTPVFVRRERSVRAIEQAIAKEATVCIVAQRDPTKNDVGPDDVYPVATEAAIGRVIKMPDGTTSVLVQGQRRVRVLDFVHRDPYIVARVSPVSEECDKQAAVEVITRAALGLYEQVVKLSKNIGEEHYIAAMNVDDPGWLADLIASTLELHIPQKQAVLEITNPIERLQRVNVLLAKELDVLQLQSKIHSEVQQEVDKTQREYFLREQLKAIQKELGEVDAQTREINELRERMAGAGLPEDVAKKADDELGRLAAMPTASPEVGVIRTYLDCLVSLPWKKASEDNLDTTRAARVLEENHYGLPKVKERILEYIAVRKLAGVKMRSPILCFVGPPGVGKTSLGRSIAHALGRKFARVSLGGIRDEAEIRGHRRTYVGALPGRIIQTMRNAGTVNPVFMMDEIDKVGLDFRGDPSAALLEVLDPEQNHAFSDHYLDVPYDLSKVMFITTANILDPVPPALRDRLEVIDLPGYVEDDKLEVARKFLVPKQLSEHGLQSERLRFSDQALRHVVREYTREAGVRNLEREIGSICRKVARQVAENRDAPTTVGAHSLAKYLGPAKYFWGVAEERDEIGVATGVSWTAAGGDLVPVEVTLMGGRGSLILTGQLGDVMKESATAALSFTRAKAKDLGLEEKFYEKLDIHIHFPAGAIPKDGPSAGITTATALISALTRRAVRRDVAMTGEITLRGRVLPIGGLKEKALAAHRAGIKCFIMPKKNIKDLTEIPSEVRKAIQFVCVERMDDVLATALCPSPVQC